MLRALTVSIVVTLALSSPARADDWVEIKTEGFTVYGDDGEKAARKVAARLEALRGFLQSEWAWARFAPDLPVVVVALEEEKQFQLLLPASFARMLKITRGTAKWFVSRILEKLGADDRTEAVTTALERGVLHR